MSRIYLLTLGLGLLSLVNCNKLIFREIDCRDFQLEQEYYWNNVDNGDSVLFHSQESEKLGFILKDKWIEHRTKYISDTGCGCHDLSGMILTNQSDTITLINQLTYVEDNEGTRYETLILRISNAKSKFYETSITTLPSHSIGDKTFSNVKKFDQADNEDANVQAIYLAENIGIIQIDMQDGTTWTNSDLEEQTPVEVSSYRFETNTCE